MTEYTEGCQYVKCNKCQGTGKEEGFLMCDKCCGTGELTWLENIFGKSIQSPPIGTLLTFQEKDRNIIKIKAIHGLKQEWLEADGSTLDSRFYPDLFHAIGYAYGGSNGKFSLPDCRGFIIRNREQKNKIFNYKEQMC